MKEKISAIIWDYDGTLVDTEEKNLNVLRKVVLKVTGREYKNFNCLLSVENHQAADYKSKNWREKYSNEFGMDDLQVDYAGSLWGEYQLVDTTQCKMFSNLSEVISKLAEYPMGIVSQNSCKNIINQLNVYAIKQFFSKIIGYEEVESSKQKPDPEGLMNCIKFLEADKINDIVLYIGDHETDMACAYNANRIYNKKRILTVAVLYGKQDRIVSWKFKPDYIVNFPEEIIDVINMIEQK